MIEGKEEAKIPLKGWMCGKLEDGDPEEGRSELPCQSGELLPTPAGRGAETSRRQLGTLTSEVCG